MKVERTPFTTYDFIGYFIPGFIFLYMMYLTFDVDLYQILSDERKEIVAHEYIMFSIFLVLMSFVVGHFLSMVSHVLQTVAIKKFDGCSCEKCCCKNCINILDYWNQGGRRIFPEDKDKYKNLVDKIFRKYEKEIGEELSIKEYTFDNNLFLKGMAAYLQEDKFKIVYNYMVIQGTFRAFSLIFLVHLMVVSSGMIFFPSLLECIVNQHWGRILLFDFMSALISWNIYLKYFRRQIEETVLLLIYDQLERKQSCNEKLTS
ncbi:MAG: hypothetical protein KF820_03225 [Candidatus Paracaedibacteraceae bacterium]|nr:hypothetical protein [Candidatus Paracaedibacteraceae bacterium]